MSTDDSTYAALSQLLARYALAADAVARPDGRDLARQILADLFTTDARIEVREQVAVEGAEAWLDVIAQSAQGLRTTQHLLGPPVIDLDGDRASLTCSLHATRIGAQGDVTRIHGTYEATAVRDSSPSWRLSHLALEILVIDPLHRLTPAPEDSSQ